VKLYSALRLIASNALLLPVKVGADLRKPALQPGIQRTLQDRGYLLMYYAICLFTPQLTPCIHGSLGRLRL